MRCVLQGWCGAAKNGHQAGFRYCRENFLSWRGLQVRHRTRRYLF